MKNILLITACSLLLSCSDQNFETANLRVNHYQQTAIGEGQRLVYLVQEGDKIGTENWTYFYSPIEGFDYDLGYIYELNVSKYKIENPPADGSSVRYVLEEVNSKEKVGNDVPFEIRLKSQMISSSPSFVTGNINAGFKLLQTTQIECSDLCHELEEFLESKYEVRGIFNHVEPGIIKLQELKFDQ